MKSLLARLLLVVFMAVAPVLALGLYTGHEASVTRRHLMEDEVLRLVRMVAEEQTRIVDSAAQVLNAVAGAPSVQDIVPGACERLLVNLLEQSPRYLSAGVVGTDGRIKCSPAGAEGRDVSGRVFFQRAMKAEGFIVGGYVRGETSGKPTIHFARAFRGRDGALAGVVVLALGTEWIGQQLDALPLPPGAIAVVTDGAGTVLAQRPPRPGAVGRPIQDKYRFTLEGNQPGITEMTHLDTRTPFIVAYSPPGANPSGWSAGVGLDKDIAYAEVTDANRLDLVLPVCLILLSLAATAAAGASLIRRPFKRLLRVADRWTAGELSARTGVAPGRDEFSRLARAFDGMAAALEAREQARRAALESTMDSVAVVDRDGRIAYLNHRAAAQFGAARALADLDFTGVFGGDSVFARARDAAVLQGAPVRIDGYDAALGRHFEVHAGPSENGGTSLFFRDVTEEQRVAAALRESEEQYRATFDQASVGMAQVALNGTWLRVNDALCAITGYAREELLGGSFRDITHPEDLPLASPRAHALIAGEAVSGTIEKRYIRKDGRTVWVNLWLSVMRDASGRPLRLIAIMEDITARKAAQAELEASETRLRLAREASGFGIWDRDVKETASVWTEDLWRLRGMQPTPDGRIEHGAWLETLHPEDRERVAGAFAVATADASRPLETVYRVIRPDGAVRWLHVKGTVVRDSLGAPLRIVGITMDVTESREAEATLRRLTNDLEARVREEIEIREAAQARAAHAERRQALGQLAAGIAHDFNNILQMVLGASNLIEAEAENASEVRSLATLISEAAVQGTATTRRLLALGRRGDLRLETVDVAALLKGLREILSHTLGGGVAVDVSVAGEVPTLHADKAQLETSLVNLAINARDAMPDGGRLTLSATAETVAAPAAGQPGRLPPGRYVRIAVADTGGGIDPAMLSHVGEPFFTTKKAGAGSGLGVAMVKGFAEQSGGAFAIDSGINQGTTVTLWLPAGIQGQPPPRAIDTGAAPGKAGTARATVLLVDDEPALRRVIARQLERAGFGVLSAASGSEALSLLDAGNAVDILVTDLSMPDMDGIALIRETQSRHPGVPAVLLTGYANDGVNLAISGAVSGTYSLLRKPVSGTQLVDRLRSLLTGRAEAAHYRG